MSQDNKQEASPAPETSPKCWCCEGETERPNVIMEQHVLIEDLPK